MSSDIPDKQAPQQQNMPIPRDVEHCERYLDRLALVVERAGNNAPAFLPIVRRLERELAEVRSESDLLRRLRDRRIVTPNRSLVPNQKGSPE